MSFNQDLGLVPGADGASIELEAQERHLVAPGTVHFAVLTTLGEVASAQAVAEPVVPVSVSVQLMSRAKPGRLVARGRMLKKGRRMAFAEAPILQDEVQVAKVSVTFAVLSG